MLRSPWLLLLLAVAVPGCARQAATTPPPTPTPEAPARPPPTPPTLRLPEGVVPLAYRLTVEVDPAVADYRGEVEVDVRLAEATDVVWLHAEELTVEEANFARGSESLRAEVVKGGDTFLGLVLPQKALPGEATLRLVFSSRQEEVGAQGLFRQNEGGTWYSFTQFEPEYARRAFPCFDEPSFKVPFTLTLRVPEGVGAYANTPQVGEEPGPRPGFKTVHFAPTPPLPSYLVAFAAGPFDVVEAGRAGQNQVPVRILTTRGRAGWATYAAQDTLGQLGPLEDYFGIPYPYAKLDLLEIPLTGTFGAMENPGLITFVSSLLLSPPERDSLQRQRSFTAVNAHELAHQWFGDLVTPAWWDDIWLNESFATWMSNKVVESRFPQWNVPLERVREASSAMAADALTSARQIRQPIEERGDIFNAFDAITYEKGGAMLQMFEHWLTPSVFREGVRSHLEAHANGVATAQDFLSAMSRVSGRDVAGAMGTFLDQPGVPLVRVGLACEAGRPAALTLFQQRYLPLGVTAPAKKQRWRVPVCVRYGGGRQAGEACTLLEEERGQLALPAEAGCPTWVAPNAQAAGYYRSQEEGPLWKALVQAPRGRLTPVEQVRLLDDASALMEAGQLPAAEVLQLAVRAAPSEDRGVVEQALAIAGELPLAQLPEALWPKHARMVRSVFGPRARALGLQPRAGEKDEVRLLRPVLLWVVGDRGEDAALRKEALALARRWLTSPTGLAPEMVPVVLELAARQADAALNAQLQAALARESNRRVRQWILRGLGSVTQPELVQQNLQLLLSPQLDVREGLEVMRPMMALPATRQAAYDFLQQHYDEVAPRLSPEMRVWLPRYASRFCDEAHRADVLAFYGPRTGTLPGGKRVLEQTLESITQCMAVRQAQQESLAAFLSRY